MQKYLLFLLLCACGMQAQNPPIADPGRVVILSERVGPVIDSTERERFSLFGGALIRYFGSTRSFRKAVVVQLPDSTYGVRFTVGLPNEAPRDTLVTYSYAVIWQLAEKINHFEEIQAGTYQPAQQPPPLRSNTGELVVSEAKRGRVASRAVGKLPLAPAEGYPYPRYFPAVDFGFGLRTYSPDVSGLAGVFGRDPDLGLSPLLSGIFEIGFAEAFAIQLEGGSSVGGEKAFQGSLGGVYYIPLSSSKKVRAFVGAAMIFCSLDSRYSGIVVNGGGSGFSGTAGLQLLLGTVAAAEVYAGYSSLPEVTTLYTDWSPSGAERVSVPASVKLSSPVLGLRVKFLE